MSVSKAWISGCIGLAPTRDERSFFADERPWGFILFRRNVSEANQLFDLVAALKEIGGGDDTPVFVDQEGGRIQRLRPPLAPNYPTARDIGAIFRQDEEAGLRASWLQGRLIAGDLLAYGINANCLPCLDVPVEGAHSVIGDRAYASEPAIVSALGRAAAQGSMAGGVLPVMKHVPGHGRGNADSHLELPVVSASLAELEEHDFPPFADLVDLPAAMTAHLLFEAVDPANPATLSPRVIEEIVRGTIGFDGLLMTDDLSMKALSGRFDERARAAVGAGCDMVLHCNGDLEEMIAVSRGVPELEGRAAERAAAAVAVIARGAEPVEGDDLRAEFDELTQSFA
ncbi:beta-N-acetylhexosaminidase [Aureimonas mangrovi]|uniref:beta-N-acetylhexosaminidase n=1 Tax=Aureimonas mangrovi TaxID=2758041 RepID=UPI00163DA46C|nr:beta-N-acetylhexosaminidase [Aureimonas mangrovi]